MRQIYTSLRHENIDRVVALMDEHAIETSVTNRSTYKGSDWKRFSYTNRPDASTWPQVWVVNANDQTRARELLREAGIEPPVRYADELAAATQAEAVTGPARHRAVASRMRMTALALVAVASVMLSLRSCGVAKQEPPRPQVIPITTH